MPYNEITWSPALGAGSNPLYDFPSGTTIADGQITPLVTPITAGSTSGWPTLPTVPYQDTSAVPSIAQINASSGMNQVIGYLNRRIVFSNAYFSRVQAVVPYVNPATPVYAIVGLSSIASIYSAVNTLLANEGFASPYPFPPATATPGGVYAGYPVLAYHVAIVRKALALTGAQTLYPTAAIYQVGCQELTGASFIFAYNISGGVGTQANQQIGIPYATGWYWVRGLLVFKIPDYASHFAGSATLTVPVVQNLYGEWPATYVNVYDAGGISSLPSTGEIYSSTGAPWPGIATGGTQVISVPYASVPITPTASVPELSGNAGNYRYFWIATSDETGGVQPPTTPTVPNITGVYENTSTLTVDWN